MSPIRGKTLTPTSPIQVIHKTRVSAIFQLSTTIYSYTHDTHVICLRGIHDIYVTCSLSPISALNMRLMLDFIVNRLNGEPALLGKLFNKMLHIRIKFA